VVIRLSKESKGRTVKLKGCPHIYSFLSKARKYRIRTPGDCAVLTLQNNPDLKIDFQQGAQVPEAEHTALASL
jgi:hypothetical protein